MSRKDTIIIAALINAAILIALFVSAMKTEKAENALALQLKELIKEPISMNKFSSPIAPTIKSAEGDEVDMALKQYSNEMSAKPSQSLFPESKDKVFSFEEKPAENKSIDFGQELKAMTLSSKSNEGEKKASEWKEVQVKKGDALAKIAKVHRTTVEEIMKVNHLKSTNLKIGQILKIPGKEGSIRSESGQKNQQTIETESEYYVIKNGDNPWTIAVKNRMKVEELLKLNHLNEETARRLKPGDKIRIR
ncbi:MAG: LysM peptidoglycan-binding domain-containing protein [Chlamydiae bacterium]|nr:LysM peptidoglycan-binding domain-containing protein [Chlamydiota bacterium]